MSRPASAGMSSNIAGRKIMGKLITVIMYLMWICTIVVGLIAVFTDFKYEDLNVMALVLVVFTILNTFFVTSKKG